METSIIPQLIINSLITGSIYALASSGLALVYGLQKILNFAHGQILMLGAYAFYLFSIVLTLNLVTSALLSVLLALSVSWLVLKIFIFPVVRFNPQLAFVTTLALGVMIESSIMMGFGVNVKSLNYTGGSLEVLDGFITPLQILIICSALILLFILALVIHSTPFGRKIRALRENASVAQSLGVNKDRVVFSVFSLSLLLAMYCGVMVGFETNLQPSMGGNYTIKAFAAMLLGGLGNIWGTVAGSYILGFIENFSIGIDLGAYSLPAGYKDAFAYVIILLVLLFTPQGLFARKGREV